jgi:hypothetical protein
VATLVAGCKGRVLLLGVTPELAAIGSRIVAADWSASAVAKMWPGNGRARQALRANWLALPCGAGTFSAAIGDGSLNCLLYPRDYRHALGELARVVRPGGRIAIRLYTRPEIGESQSVIRTQALAGDVGTIHALKWRLAHAMCAERAVANVAVRDILATFNHMFPDRSALRGATAWTDEEIATVDAYRDLADVFSFPTVDQVLAVMPPWWGTARLEWPGRYELAERCPLLIIDVPEAHP